MGNLRTLATAAALVASLNACSDRKTQAPPRSNEPVPAPGRASLLSIPVDIDIRALTRVIETSLPRQLWTIERHSSRCVAPQEVKVFGRKLKVTPPISCTIRGVVTRGAVRLRGTGQQIVADVPVQARIGAYDVGGVLKGKTATGSAVVHAAIRLTFRPDWTPVATVHLDHDWVNAPGIDFLGQRITFTEQAEEKLAPVIRQLERELPQELARMNVRRQVEALWREGFTAVELNKERPPVWMRLTPQTLRYGGYEIRGQQLRLNLGLDALTETFVGNRPPDAKVTPLPPLAPIGADRRLRFHIPVVADYKELEPVILRALQKRAAQPFTVPGVGQVNARFDRIVAYGTDGNRIAIGVSLAAKAAVPDAKETRGLVWLVARPVNVANSAVVAFEDMAISGNTDGVGGDLLLELARSGAVTSVIAGSLTQNFSKDLDELLGKIRRAVANKQAGQFVIQAQIERFETGRIAAYGQGLYLPVDVEGQASVVFRPSAP